MPIDRSDLLVCGGIEQTSFGKAGAVLADIPLLRANIGADVKITAVRGSGYTLEKTV